jgi:2-polyprenyl-6-methoxyphenol hydroxylase-like FAD-dependent oxidoreductase
VETDIFVIGGGITWCMVAIAVRAHAPAVTVTILEKGRDLFFDEVVLSPQMQQFWFVRTQVS